MSDDFTPQDPLWKLLGNASQTPVRPGFARDVLRTIRNQEEPAAFSWSEFLKKALFPLSTVAATAIVLALALGHNPPAGNDLSTAFVEAADLEELVSPSAGWTWQEVAP